MALGSTQPLTEMSTKKIAWGADCLENVGAFTACYRDSFTFTYNILFLIRRWPFPWSIWYSTESMPCQDSQVYTAGLFRKSSSSDWLLALWSEFDSLHWQETFSSPPYPDRFETQWIRGAVTSPQWRNVNPTSIWCRDIESYVVAYISSWGTVLHRQTFSYYLRLKLFKRVHIFICELTISLLFGFVLIYIEIFVCLDRRWASGPSVLIEIYEHM
jgi:hypothetical protein